DRVVTSDRRGMTYNAQGRITSYVDTEHSTAAPGRDTTSERKNITYNDAGQMASWTDEEKTGYSVNGQSINLESLAVDVPPENFTAYIDTSAAGSAFVNMTLEDFLGRFGSAY